MDGISINHNAEKTEWWIEGAEKQRIRLAWRMLTSTFHSETGAFRTAIEAHDALAELDRCTNVPQRPMNFTFTHPFHYMTVAKPTLEEAQEAAKAALVQTQEFFDVDRIVIYKSEPVCAVGANGTINDV